MTKRKTKRRRKAKRLNTVTAPLDLDIGVTCYPLAVRSVQESPSLPQGPYTYKVTGRKEGKIDVSIYDKNDREIATMWGSIGEMLALAIFICEARDPTWCDE